MAANALIEVRANGRTRTLALPPSPLVPFPRDAVPTSVTEGPDGAATVLLDGLTFPGGFAIGPDDAAYITNFGTSATGGEVLRLPLSPC